MLRMFNSYSLSNLKVSTYFTSLQPTCQCICFGYDDDNWSQCSISYPFTASTTIVGKKESFYFQLHYQKEHEFHEEECKKIYISLCDAVCKKNWNNDSSSYSEFFHPNLWIVFLTSWGAIFTFDSERWIVISHARCEKKY